MSYLPPPRRGAVARAARGVDEFTAWLLYGYETWLVAVLKGVPLFLFIYFLVFYVPNYVYYAVTLYILDFSKDVGFLAASLVGGGNFTALIAMAVWAQAARGRQGFFWSLIRWLVFLQYLLTMLVLIPFMVFNLGGGSIIPPVFTFQALALGAVTAGLGAVSVVYLWFEFRRITRREAAEAAEAASRMALSTGR